MRRRLAQALSNAIPSPARAVASGPGPWRAALGAAAALCFITGTALAALAPTEPASAAVDTNDVEEITITGQRPSVLRQQMDTFVVEIGDPASFNRGYARWRDRLCVGVFNLPDATVAQYLVDQITVLALELGLETGSPGCKPNLNIVFSPDARELAGRMIDNDPAMFRPYGGTGGTTQGTQALERFRSSEAPVRWWQITMVVDELGLPAFILPDAEGTADTANMPQYRGMASRIKSPLSDAIWGELVIVDARKLGTVRWPQLAAYLAMVSLAQVAPDSQPAGYDSILNLFSDSTPPAGLSDMDRVYQKALYTIDTQVFPRTQRGLLANQMVRELGALDGED